jgi:hypothetical protein
MGIPFKQWLLGAITFATVLMGLLKIWIYQTPETGMQEFCSWSLYFSFLAWAGGQLLLIWLRVKEQARKEASGAGENIELSESALSSAETYFQLGENIDTVCAMVEPRYADWSLERRGEFREGLLKSIQDRRGKREESATA